MASSATATPDADKIYYADLVSFARLLYQQAEHDEHCTCSKEESTSGCTIKVSWLRDTLPHLKAGFSAYAEAYIRDRAPMIQVDDTTRRCSQGKRTPGCTIKVTQHKGLTPDQVFDFIRPLIAYLSKPEEPGICYHDPMEQSGNVETTGPLTSSVALGAMYEADATPVDITISGISSAPSSPSTTMTESQPLDSPGSPEPLKPLQDLDLPTFPGLNEKMEANPRPSACQAFKTIWSSYDELVGENAETDSAHLSTSPLPQLHSRLVEAEDALAHPEHQTTLAVLEYRVDEVMLAMCYNEKIERRESQTHTDECDRLQTETVLDEMIQEGFRSKSSDDHLIDAGEFPREKLCEWIGLGQFFLKLIAEFGWGAMIYPGLCIEQDDLKEMGQEELDKIMEFIQYHYGTTAWRKELLDISPTIFTLIMQGIPEGQTLRILTVTDGGKTELMDLPLSEWLRFIPITDGKPSRAPKSRFSPLEQNILRRVPCPASTSPELEGQNNS
ncbi:uncharacterized protein NECHADRAFT_88494 [Fusarium vanettenii 77-13-4]|uniref:Uncharacterized protein n=1 Tax=Fusarium vanettenii (strain ATCC MYA-4622 / CBS 123669 / FGSC 9596 / NRRL 45880 / 77-13-4) TaxID=660122 RepID=C7ZBQ7_FUSV7|nr:uncharacterized protein NECHADRAFT_88494 [Fusarium vanettenii 77-13-4]EEU38605.1 predicted protein [Fusarium vanettenii 77-13-4]